MTPRAPEERRLAIDVPAHGTVSGVLHRPERAAGLFLFAHGAGAGMRHRFMDAAAAALAGRRIATLRYQFPYMEAGRRFPDPKPTLLATVRAAAATAVELAGDLPVVAGGKSMGGRMTTLAAADAADALRGVSGLVLVGFPLHPARKPGTARGDHLRDVGFPMLFLQGTRDDLADLELLRPVLASVEPEPVLRVVRGADHGFHVLKRSGRTDGEVLEELATATADWIRALDAS